ncbi:unnamed protein product [Rhizoctonia solani]|uniref:Uncharacterized protein n=1 Tax=Rhizoctonia solani TaxID=456999 RepID=A0A8H3D825_9AGAM|nr:unnamed protein product [Rhizoctonia solani]
MNDTARLSFITDNRLEKIDTINKFIARVFLRGRSGDGSSRFNPDGQQLQIPERVHEKLGVPISKRRRKTKDKTILGQSLMASWSDAPPNINSPTFTPYTYLARQHPKSMCCISHSKSAFPYGDLFDILSTYAVIKTNKKGSSVSEAVGRFSKETLRTGLCILRGHSWGNSLPNVLEGVKADALIYWGLPAQDSYAWPSRITPGQFTYIYLIIPPDQLPTVTSLTGTNFQEHPESTLLNAQGPDSLLDHSRMRARSALGSVASHTVINMAHCYKPVHPPAYPFEEFLRKVMLQTDH